MRESRGVPACQIILALGTIPGLASGDVLAIFPSENTRYLASEAVLGTPRKGSPQLLPFTFYWWESCVLERALALLEGSGSEWESISGYICNSLVSQSSRPFPEDRLAQGHAGGQCQLGEGPKYFDFQFHSACPVAKVT